MRLVRWMAIGMTGTAMGGTVWLAATGGRIGMVIVGFAVSVFGIIVVAVTDPGVGGGE